MKPWVFSRLHLYHISPLCAAYFVAFSFSLRKMEKRKSLLSICIKFAEQQSALSSTMVF